MPSQRNGEALFREEELAAVATRTFSHPPLGYLERPAKMVVRAGVTPDRHSDTGFKSKTLPRICADARADNQASVFYPCSSVSISGKGLA